LEVVFFHQRRRDFLAEAIFQPRRLFGAMARYFRRALLFLLRPTLFLFFLFSHFSNPFSRFRSGYRFVSLFLAGYVAAALLADPDFVIALDRVSDANRSTGRANQLHLRNRNRTF